MCRLVLAFRKLRRSRKPFRFYELMKLHDRFAEIIEAA
jgi:hypothetical protein